MNVIQLKWNCVRGIGIWWVSYVTDSPCHVTQTESNEVFISSFGVVFFFFFISMHCIAHRHLHTNCYRRRPHKPRDRTQRHHKPTPVLRQKINLLFWPDLVVWSLSHHRAACQTWWRIYFMDIYCLRMSCVNSSENTKWNAMKVTP